MSGTRYPLNLAEACWRLELRKPELIDGVVEKVKTYEEVLQILYQQIHREETPKSVEEIVGEVLPVKS